MSVAPQPTVARQSPARGRILVAAVLVLSLAASALTRNWVIESHLRRHRPRRPIAADDRADPQTQLSAMPAYATALLLGGLRGPLVMMLWTSSENQKQERKLEDFDTKIEWIRLLQPEFDTVHLFQMWNKAYNISVHVGRSVRQVPHDSGRHRLRPEGGPAAPRRHQHHLPPSPLSMATSWAKARNIPTIAGRCERRRRRACM